jgi:hypothetical protein
VGKIVSTECGPAAVSPTSRCRGSRRSVGWTHPRQLVAHESFEVVLPEDGDGRELVEVVVARDDCHLEDHVVAV